MEIKRSILKSMKDNTSNDCIIYLSGPSSLDTPLDILASTCVIGVNGSVGHLIENAIPVFAYVVCDGSFYKNRKNLFYKYVKYARYTFISENVLEMATEEEKQTLLKSCYLLKDLCKSRGGPGRKIRYGFKTLTNSSVFIQCSFSKKNKIIAFSNDVSQGHFGSATVAFTALQIAITIGFERIIFSGLDLTGDCKRFYNDENEQPTNLPNDLTFILDSFSFAKDKIKSRVYNLSEKTAIPYDLIPYLDKNTLLNE